MTIPAQEQDVAPKIIQAAAPSESTHTFRVGTRKSLLAQAQADGVVKALREVWPEHNFEIHAMSTVGDKNQKTALYKFNERALWTQELEILLEGKELDLIVHSLKDMSTQLPPGLTLGCVTKREDPRDAFVLKHSLVGRFQSLHDLPEGAVVGTSSLRRTAQLKRFYPQLRYQDIRGNIGTRLAKLDDPESEYTAIVIAVAGLVRLGMTDRINTYLSQENGGMLFAVGQGALGIEIREDDQMTARLLAPIACNRTTLQVLAERQLMQVLEGGCSVPVGVETEWVSERPMHRTHLGVGAKPTDDGSQPSGRALTSDQDAKQDGLTDELIMRAIVVSLDGKEAAEIETSRRITTEGQARELGREAAKMLVEKGADKILQGIVQAQGKA